MFKPLCNGYFTRLLTLPLWILLLLRLSELILNDLRSNLLRCFWRFVPLFCKTCFQRTFMLLETPIAKKTCFSKWGILFEKLHSGRNVDLSHLGLPSSNSWLQTNSHGSLLARLLLYVLEYCPCYSLSGRGYLKVDFHITLKFPPSPCCIILHRSRILSLVRIYISWIFSLALSLEQIWLVLQESCRSQLLQNLDWRQKI